MRTLKAAALFIALASIFAPGARAEYAVLRSGMRIHISGYENMGSILRLHIPGGTVDVAIENIVAIEPEELFPAVAPPAVKSLPIERYPELINAAAKKYGLDPQLLAAVAAAESNFDTRAISRKNAQGVMQLPRELGLAFLVEERQHRDLHRRKARVQTQHGPLLTGDLLLIVGIDEEREHRAADPERGFDYVRDVALLVTDPFDAATAERKIDGFSSFLADNVATLRADEPVLRGKAALQQDWKGLLENKSMSLRWQPISAEISKSGDLGYTVGSYTITQTDEKGGAIQGTGKYLTVWRLQKDGLWKVEFDTGVPDTPPAPQKQRQGD